MVAGGVALLAACGEAEQVDAPTPTLPAACAAVFQQSTSTATPATPEEEVELTRDQIIQCTLAYLGADPRNQPDAATATARRMPECEAREMVQWEGVPPTRPSTPPSESSVWLVEVSGEFGDPSRFGPTPAPLLRGRYFWVLDPYGLPRSGGMTNVVREDGPELSREEIVERALHQIEDPESPLNPSTATASRTTYGDALATAQQEGAPQDIAPSWQSDRPVWLVEVRGDFAGSCAQRPRAGRYLLILGLDGFVGSSGFLPDAAS